MLLKHTLRIVKVPLLHAFLYGIGDKEKAAIPYYSLRRGIQEQNPAGKPVQQSTKQETEEENG